MEVNDDGSIEGLTGKATEANAVLIAHFVELMETFIGENVTMWLLTIYGRTCPAHRSEIRGRNRDDQHDLAVEAQEVVQTRD